jgi:hypothetical protein
MSGAQVIARQQLGQILEEAIMDQRRLTLTFSTAQGWRTFKSQFVGGSATRQALQIQSAALGETAASLAPCPGDTVGVAFRTGHKKCLFASTIQSIEAGGGGTVATLQWPQQLQQLQRRAYERAKPPHDAVVAVRFWPEEGQSGVRCDTRDARHGQLEDVSAGGLRVKVANATDVRIGVTYRCVFTPQPGRPPLILDTVVRHREAAEHGRASIGFQVVGLEITPDGRRVLDRLARTVAHYQRARARHQR